MVIWNGSLGAAEHLGKREPLPTEPRPSVVQLRKGAAGTPVYLIDAGSWELRLAQLMPLERSIFATECYPWPLAWRAAAAENKTYALPTMRQLAAPYVSALSIHTRSSPCVLVGYSFSGVIAFETAQQLHELGGKVEMVILLDSQAKHLTTGQVAWRHLKRDWQRAPNPRSITSRLGSSLYIVWWMVRTQLGWLRRHFRRTVRGDLGYLTHRLDGLGMPLPWALVEQVYLNALRSYSLRNLDCRGVLFRSDPTGQGPERDLDGSLGWDGLFDRGLQIIQMTGSHHSMILEPHNMLAQELSNLLNWS